MGKEGAPGDSNLKFTVKFKDLFPNPSDLDCRLIRMNIILPCLPIKAVLVPYCTVEFEVSDATDIFLSQPL
jgi:hypothetical protein